MSPAKPQLPAASKNWHPIALRLARMLDEAMTLPKVALENTSWAHEANTLIKELGIQPGSSKASVIFRRYQEPQR